MQPIRLAFTDTDMFDHPAFLTILKAHFDVVVDDVDPHFVIHGIYPGFEFLKYPNAIRIFKSAEITFPDFNICDFAFGYAHIEFDRYMRMPNYFLYSNFSDLISKNRSISREVVRDRFCNYIYSNLHAHPMRTQLFEAINEYKLVHAHGAHLKNAETLETPTATHGWNEAKLRMQARYKFTIVAENATLAGYTTEKMTDALWSHTVPIYWGNPEIARDFNPARFINVHNFANLDEVVAEVRRLDQDDAAYARMLAAPIFTPDNLACAPTEARVVAFMRQVFSHAAPVRSRVFWGAWYEERIKSLLADREHLELTRKAYNEAEADRSRLAQLEHDQRGRISQLELEIAGLSGQIGRGSMIRRLARRLRRQLTG